jgi:DNA-directed RNA polymerase specialized sigma24 family protein
MTDNELLDLIYENEAEGFSLLIDTYTADIYKIVREVLGYVTTEKDIEECISDSFMAFYNNIDDVDLSRGSLKAYIAVIAKHRAMNLYYTLNPDDNAAFNEYTVEEMTQVLQGESSQEDRELSKRIKFMCFEEIAPDADLEYSVTEEVTEEKYDLPDDEEETKEPIAEDSGRVIVREKRSPFARVLKTVVSMVLLVSVITVGVIVVDRFSDANKVVTTTTTTQPTTQPEPYNPLLSAIISGNESLIESLIGNSLLLTQDVLKFAIESADKISYDSIRRIAEEVRNKYGSTGLDPILDGAIFGNPQDVIDKLKDKDEKDMTPAERLAYYFVEAFTSGN